MGLESATYLNDLVSTNPDGAVDAKSQGDDHLRLMKTVLKATFPGLAGRFRRVTLTAIAYTAALIDNTSIIRFSSAQVLNLPVAATAGNGYELLIYNNSTGSVTITPNGAEKVNGLATVLIPPECFALIFCQNVASFEYLAMVCPLVSVEGTGADIAGNTSLTVTEINGGIRRITATALVTLPAIATVPAGRRITLKSVTTADVTWKPNGGETADGIAATIRIPSYTAFTLQANGSDWIIVTEPSSFVGELKPISVALAATRGWEIADFGAISRATYAGLFAVIGSGQGPGDGATTFNKPDTRSRGLIGDGQSTFVETITTVTAAANAVAIGSNADTYITGDPVVVSAASGFTGLVNGSYFIIRVDATHISFATTLANAQNGTVMAISGTGNATFTMTFVNRTVGQRGGEEGHVMSLTELIAHSHTLGNNPQTQTVSNASGYNTGNTNTGTTGGNVAMNNMQPYLAARFMVKT